MPLCVPRMAKHDYIFVDESGDPGYMHYPESGQLPSSNFLTGPRDSLKGSVMDWREDYKRKLGSPEDAAALVKSGDLVHTGSLPMPRLIADAIVARREEFEHLDVKMDAPEYDPGFMDNAFSDKFSVTVEIHIGNVAIDAMDERRIDYSPVLFSTWFKPVTDPRPDSRAPDVYLCTVSPPDKNGYCSFGAGLVEQAHVYEDVSNRFG